MKITSVKEIEFESAEQTRMGWCAACEAFTTPDTAAGLIGKSCHACDRSAVNGVGVALEAGLIRVVDRKVIK